MNICVNGSRGFQDYELMQESLRPYFSADDVLLSGGAKGADSLAEKFAAENGIRVIRYLPDWEKYGKPAGIIRNEEMLNSSQMLISFHDGKSPGTAHAISYAKRNNIECVVIRYDLVPKENRK